MIGTLLLRKIALAGLGLSALQLSACMQPHGGMSHAACVAPCVAPGYSGAGYGGVYGMPSTTTVHGYSTIYQQPAVISIPQVIENHHTVPVSQYAVEPFASMDAHGTHQHVDTSFGANGRRYTTYSDDGYVSRTTRVSPSVTSPLISSMGGTGIYSNGVSAYGVTSEMVTLTQSDCPAGTTLQSDGTCLQGASSMTSLGTTSSTYSSGGSTTGSSACPAGMISSGNGICMSSSYTGSQGTSYTSNASVAVGCPAGTIAQPDGTCMQSSSSHSTTSTTTTGYLPVPKKPGHYYRPVKK